MPSARRLKPTTRALARAHRWQRLLESGECGSITELAAAEKIDRSYLCRVLRLTLLAPEMVEAIVGGRQPEGLTLPGLIKGFPIEWGSRRAWQRLTICGPNVSFILRSCRSPTDWVEPILIVGARRLKVQNKGAPDIRRRSGTWNRDCD